MCNVMQCIAKDDGEWSCLPFSAKSFISQLNLNDESIFVTKIRMLSLFGDMSILSGLCMTNALLRLFITNLSAVAVKATRGTLGRNALS